MGWGGREKQTERLKETGVDRERVGAPQQTGHTAVRPPAGTAGASRESLRTDPGHVACLVFLPLWP